MVYIAVLVSMMFIVRYILIFLQYKKIGRCASSIRPRFGMWRGMFCFLFTAFIMLTSISKMELLEIKLYDLLFLLSMYGLLFSIWATWCWCSLISVQVSDGLVIANSGIGKVNTVTQPIKVSIDSGVLYINDVSRYAFDVAETMQIFARDSIAVERVVREKMFPPWLRTLMIIWR